MFKKDNSPIHITLDGGATGSFVRLDYAIKNKFKIFKNNQTAGLADNITNVKSLGYVEETFYRDNWNVQFKALVVDNLKADCYGGQPFLIENDIIQRPKKQIITVHGKYTVMQTNANIPATMPYSSAILTIANMKLNNTVLFPGQSIDVTIPPTITTPHVIIEPRLENKQNWPSPQVINVTDGKIQLSNNQDKPVILGNDVHVVSISACDEIDQSKIKQIPHTSTNIVTRKDHINQVNKTINKNVLSETQIKNLETTHTRFQDVFDGQMTGYNGYYGKHFVTLQWADDSRPKTSKLYSPKWSSSKDLMLQKKIDQLTEMGVLADPYKHDIQVKSIHPCFLQKKSRAAHKDIDNCDISEVRFLTAPNSVNEKCRQVQTKVPDQTEIFQFLGKNPCVIYADLFESFFQNHLCKKDWGYMAINSPFKGLRVYTRSTQGLLNQDEELQQLLNKVLGDLIMNGICMKIADDLLIGGKSYDDAILNWQKVLEKLSLSNLKLSPSKVRIFPSEATIFGWLVKGNVITPDPHRKVALTKTRYIDIKTISDMRSWMGIYKTFLIAMPALAEIMDPFDKLVAGVKDGKALITWTEDLKNKFEIATNRIINDTKYLSLPRPDEQLVLMPDATVKDPAIGFILNVVRQGKMLPVIYYSYKLNDNQKNWFPCEREALAVAISVKKCSHYIVESKSPTLILTDSKPVVEAAKLISKGKFSASSRMTTFLMSINRYKLDIQHVSGKYGQNLAADYLSRNPSQCINSKCQVCKFITETAQSTLASIESSNDIPLGNLKSWKLMQEQDFACSEAYKRLKSGQQPAKKGPFSNDIRRYYNVCQAKELLVVEDKIPNTTQTTSRIVIPKEMVQAVIVQLHYSNEKHLSAYQLEKVFNRYYFGIHIKQIIHEVLDNCMLCKANKTIQKTTPEYRSVSNPEHPGLIFNADVMKKHGQKFLICTDLFSSYTTAKIISNEKSTSLLQGLIECVTPIRSTNPILIRTDAATGFQALQNDPSLQKLHIKIEITDPSNKNSIATVDKAIRELENEIVKIAPHSSAINQTVLSAALQSLNSKIRNRGLSAHEILFSRENQSNKNLTLSDDKLLNIQKEIKESNNEKSAAYISKIPSKNDCFQIGDIISIKSEKNKNNIRDGYMITSTNKETLQVNKLIRFHGENTKLQNKPRIIQSRDAYKIVQNVKNSNFKNSEINPSKLEPEHIKIQKGKGVTKPAKKWQAFGNFEISFDENYEQPKSKPISLNLPNEINNETDDEFFDFDDTIIDENQNDPYNEYREWERNQRIHARESLNHLNSTPKSTTADLVNNINCENLPRQRLRSSTNYEWDHNFDLNHSTLSSSIDSDVFTLPNPSPFLQVHNVDELILRTSENIDTNRCQLLEGLLPPPLHTSGKKKRISPPRQQLPMERTDTQESESSPPPAARTRSRTR